VRIIRGRRRGKSALILGQRPTSPKGAQCYVGPLAHCGSHCCANCITTGSGRDLPSVARNSVSRGLVLGTAQCNSTTALLASTSDVAGAFYGRHNVHRITGYVIRRINAVRPRLLLRVACSKRVPFRTRVDERKLIARPTIGFCAARKRERELSPREIQHNFCFSLSPHMTVNAIN